MKIRYKKIVACWLIAAILSGSIPAEFVQAVTMTQNQNVVTDTKQPKAPEKTKTGKIIETGTNRGEKRKTEKLNASDVKRQKPKVQKTEISELKNVGKNAQKLKTQEIKTQEPKTQEPKTQEPKTQKPKTQEPKTQEPKTQEPKTQEPKTQELKTQEPKTQESKTQGPKTSEPKLTEKSTAATPSGKETPAAITIKPTENVALPTVVVSEIPTIKPTYETGSDLEEVYGPMPDENQEELTKELLPDLDVDANITLTEDTECNALTVKSGTLNLNGHNLIVHGDAIIKNATLNVGGGTLEIYGNLILGEENARAILSTGSDESTVTVEKTLKLNNGSIQDYRGKLIVKNDLICCGMFRQYDGGRTEVYGNMSVEDKGYFDITYNEKNYLKIYGDLNIDTEAESKIATGTIEVKGDITQSSLSNPKSFKGAIIKLTGDTEQKIRLAYPENTCLGDLDVTESAGADLGEIIYATEFRGIEKIKEKEKLQLKVYAVRLTQDTVIHGDVELKEGSMCPEGHNLYIQGNLTLGEENTRAILYTGDEKNTVTVEKTLKLNKGSIENYTGKLTVKGDLICSGMFMQRNGGNTEVYGNMSVDEKGYFDITYNEKNYLKIHGDLNIDTEAESKIATGTIEVKGDITQSSLSNPKSFKGSTIKLTGDTAQHIDVAYPKNINIGAIDLSKCKKAYFYQDIYSYNIKGLNKIANIEKIDIYSKYMELTGNCTIDGDFICRGCLNIVGHKMTVSGDLTAKDYLYIDCCTENNGEIKQEVILNIEGSLRANSTVNVCNGMLKVHKNMTVGCDGLLTMYDRNARVVVGGNLKINSKYSYNTALTAGVLKVSGNLVQGEHANYKCLAHTSNFLIKLDGDKLQKVNIPRDVVFYNLDISESKGVAFKNETCISKLKGWDKIRGDEIVIRDSIITLTEDTKLNTSLAIINSHFDLAAHSFEIKGDVEQIDSQMQLSEGKLTVSGNYLMNGYSRLYMINEKDTMEVKGGFETGSCVSHDGLLRAGTFYLGGDFKQWGNEYSFCATDKHLMVFNGKGSEKQKVYMQSRPESTFSNVRVDGTGYCSVEEGSVFIGGMSSAIIAGIADAVEEEWDSIVGLIESPEQISILADMVGVSIAFPHISGFAAICLTAYQGSVYVTEMGDMVTGDADRYMKARYFAKQATHLLFLLVLVKGVSKAGQFLKDEYTASSWLKSMHSTGKFYSDEQILFSMKEIVWQKTLCEKLVETEALSGISEITKLTDAERIDLYDVLKLASKERKVNKFELETFFTKLAEEGISTDDYIEWLGNARTNLLTETECTYEDLYNYLRKHKKKYAEEFKKKAAWPETVKFPETKEQLTVMLSDKKNIAFADLICKELRKHGITLSEFNKMRKKSMANLTEKEVEILKAIRDAVSRPDEDTMLQKVIPVTDIKKYMGENGYSTIRGFVSKRADVEHLKTYDDVVEALRLDYLDGGNRPFPYGGDSYGYIKFRTDQVDKIGIPYGKKFGGNNTDGWPCTLNGFTAAEKDIIPEWVVMGEDGLKIKDGAELHRVVNGRDTIIGIFSKGHFISK